MKKVLVFGGTRFFGKKLVKALIDNGHDVTIATRGITKDNFSDKVKRVIVDRDDENALMEAFRDKSYDVIYDNICYSPNAAKYACNVFNDNVNKYIFTSTLSVYDAGLNLKEENFDPYGYKIKYGKRDDFDYGEGKRLAEAVFFQEAPFQVVAVRFPVVIGEEDYTNRLISYSDNICKGEAFYVDNLDSTMSFISSQEAGEFLHWISTKDFQGPINACCNGTIKIKEIIKLCEEKYNKKWISAEDNSEKAGAFNGFYKFTLENKKAREMGFRFKNVFEETKKLI
ncbi:NAD dependent epimerase/dehydratase family protein [Clostridium homopropionicum DSM 5847]|uniref:NAD dependent epimerase/dehydratase family protein n=1 Tax=Clostridium homopropionicum DSM 5847 TaxID=1121318 RepID=A0A0L6ZAG3_9CLOT|nr:NAD-dependent epimerase/dehydratase family protein [Clostridium homopropionicum]KOA19966.1 NAD dependent epimerase/dehydratase family protein [Clostridium homopropionicum DSM 5847]SFG63492.1 Nucleoside-diphosphate-sugar epimerase [Clostridium homopropionicum]